MGRIDTTNVNLARNKMYSAIGTKYDSNDAKDDLVQNGMFGSVGKQITHDTYEFLAPKAGKDVFVMATPEVDADENNVENNSLHGFKMVEGQIGDIVELSTHDIITIEADMIEKFNDGSAKVGHYVSVVPDKRLLQYDGSVAPSKGTELLIGEILDISSATQRVVYNGQLNPMGLTYKLVKVRFIQK